MSNPMNNTSLYLLPGMSAKFKATGGFYVAHGTMKILDGSGGYKDATLTQGFAVQYDDVGTIEKVDNEPAVIYTHKKFGLNKVYFFAAGGEN
jgi:hypothetical protein